MSQPANRLFYRLPTGHIRLSILVAGLFILTLLGGCTVPITSLATLRPVPPAGHFVQDATTAEFLDGPVTVALAGNVPNPYANAILDALLQLNTIEAANGAQPLRVLDSPETARAVVRVVRPGTVDTPLLERYYAVVAPFATTTDDVSLRELQQRWQGFGSGPLLVTPDAAAMLQSQWANPSSSLVAETDLLAALAATPGAWGVLAFDHLDPRYKVLTIDGSNVLSNQFDPTHYPLGVALVVEGTGQGILTDYLRQALDEAPTNRDPAELTTLLMTGVTAMARGTAAAMTRSGILYPAAVISATFAAADITHISNEIPFLDDCVVNNTVNNLILCSHTDYWATLEAVGTDIVGLSGNHVNDFGYAGARRSLQFYQDNDIPIYGSGFTPEEACAPLRWEHNGNTFAFIAALAYGPSSAWVTDEEPGACYYYDHKEEVLASIRAMAETVDIVAVELQYEETYFPYPTANQVLEFRELREAGADIVTGVQSHVPQAMEPYGVADAGGPGIIVYGLGNLFFDQMWSWETRTELYARHSIYQGRVLSTEILTGVLEDFAQPRWTTPEERVALLQTIFDAAPPRPEE
jgi:poly-gamma-glutamate synthesis protein (capsule biosynthesis protein)